MEGNPAGRIRLRILHLEDDSADAALVREVLDQEGVQCDILVARDRAMFEAAIRDEKVDLILSDFNLPDIRGDEALELVRAKWPDLPFICVSGSIGEERAVGVVRKGASDYVMKERLRRLGVAIHRAIEEAEQRQQRRVAEASLKAEREFLNDLFTSVQDGIVVLNEHMELVRANPTVERLFAHLAPLAGKPWTVFYNGADKTEGSGGAAERTFTTGKTEQEYRKCHTHRGDADFNIFAFPLVERRTGLRTGVILYLRDVTQELLLRRQLIQAQKMECIGQLAGSVAHDFNNILQSIIIAAELLAQATPESDPRYGDVEEIRKTAERAVALTRQLTTFSRKDVLTPVSTDLNALVRNMGAMLNRLIARNIVIKLALDPGLAPVTCDSGRVEQVVLNLVVNARDAMPEGGEIEIATANRRVTPDEARVMGLDAREGSFVCLSVRDTGTGIAPEHMAHLFEPFFTTKSSGKGTGLGLPTVYGIVKQHNGWIVIDSTLGKGTLFTVFLPADRPA